MPIPLPPKTRSEQSETDAERRKYLIGAPVPVTLGNMRANGVRTLAAWL